MSDMNPKKPTKSEVDWDAVEVHYRAGMRSLDDIGKEYGVSKGRISQVAKKKGWERDLGPKIKQRTEARVARDTAQAELNRLALNDPAKREARRLVEAEVVELNVTVKANVIRDQKKSISRANGVFLSMLGELETIGNDQGQSLVELLIQATSPAPEDETTEGAARRVARQKKLLESIVDLPGRIDSGKRLVETLEKLVRMEREAYGIATEEAPPEASPIATLLQRVKNTSLGVVFEVPQEG